MKNLSCMERRMLLYKHIKDGCSYKEAYEMVRRDCEAIKELNKKNKIKKPKNFKESFQELVSKTNNGY